MVRGALSLYAVQGSWIYSYCTQASPTLNLVNECFRFVTGFFEVISTSAPHIYHSAIYLSPRTSIVWKLYKRYAHPLTRVVQGAPISWDPAVATIKCSHFISHAAWSPCSKFIAISLNSKAEIQILDAVTLKQLKSLIPPHNYTQLLTFSPDSHLLTWVSHTSEVFVSWDLQTGLLASEISITEEGPIPKVHSITYSGCGTMLGVLFKNNDISTINTYSVLSNSPICSHPVEGLVAGTIWTHGECVQFTIFGSGSITIWEVGFTTEHPPTEVKSVNTPNNFDPSEQFHFLPKFSRLAFVLEEAVIIWDTQLSKPLLNSMDAKMTENMTFSADGHFFACEVHGSEIYLWKESPTGYTLHQKFVSGRGSVTPLLSPNGQLIVGPNSSTIWLWHTEYFITSPSSTPTKLPWSARRFTLEFSPDRSLAATARLETKTATILDLKSGIPLLIIDTGTPIYGLRIADDTVVVIGDRKIITWDLPVGGVISSPRVGINGSAQTITFTGSTSSTLSMSSSTPPMFSRIYSASISPDFNHFAIIAADAGVSIQHLIIFDMATGKYLAGGMISFSKWGIPWFTQDGKEVWYHDLRDGDGWGYYARTINELGRVFRDCGWATVKDGNSNITALEHIRSSSGIPPWQSPHGHQVTDNKWIISSGGKQLLMLPHHWQPSEGVHRIWGGQFLALLHNELHEVVILELLEG